MPRRLVPLVLTLGLLGGGSACDSDATTAGPGTPSESTPPGSPVPERDPDIVVSVYSTGFEGNSGTGVPDFQLRRDGTVFLNGDDDLGIDHYRLTDAGVDQVLDVFADVPLHDDAFGVPQVTDLNSTSVYLNAGRGPTDEPDGNGADDGPVGVTVHGLGYGLGYGDRGDLESMLDDDQVDARQTLHDALSTLDDLSADAEDPDEQDDRVAKPRAPYTPEDVELVLNPAVSDRADSLVTERTRDGVDDGVVEWPLDTPLTKRPLRGGEHGPPCASLHGEDATTVAALAADADEDALWTTGAEHGSGLPTHVRLKVHGRLSEQPPEDSADSADSEPGAVCDGAVTQPDTMMAGPFSPVRLADPPGWDGELSADAVETARVREVLAAAPILAEGMVEYRDSLHEDETRRDADPSPDDPLSDDVDSAAVPTRADLTWYNYDVIVATVDGTHYLDVEASRQPPSEDRSDPQTWRARVDLAEEKVTTVEIDTE